MTINFSPNVGKILECNFGEYTLDESGAPTNQPNHHIPPEMIKNRLVVVLNGKVSGSSCVVVPLSTTHDVQKTHKGLHVEIPKGELPDLVHFEQAIRWAKADMVQQVSKLRLNRPRSGRGRDEVKMSSEVVTKIQRAVVKAVNASSLLIPLNNEA